MLSGLAAQQRCTCLHAALSNALDNVRDLFRNNLAHGDVVLEEERLGAAHDEVINTHGNQVDADSVVLIHGLSHGQLGAHAV